MSPARGSLPALVPRRRRRPAALAAVALLGLGVAGAGRAQVLVDIANDANDPSHLSDTEPSIAVNPTNPQEISIVSFSEGWSASTGAPVWKSRDGGLTWTKVTQLTQPSPSSSGPADQKIAYDAAGNLYVAELPSGIPVPDSTVFRQTAGPDDPLTPGALYGNDQPHLDLDRSATSAFFGRLYSPWLDFSLSPERSTVAESATGGAAIANVGAGDNSTFPNRTTRIALAPNGHAFIVYKTREGVVGQFENAHFRVARSDDGGVTWNALGAGGISVHGTPTVLTWFTTTFGNSAKGKVNRARSSDGWIAADPVTGDVYVAYVSQDASTFGQIYVARSTTDGMTWTSTRVTDGTHHSAFPEIAVAANGGVGMLYIDYDDSGASTLFRHHFANSFDHAGTWHDEILQTFDPGPIANAVDGFIWGDYEGLTAMGHTFYGVFTGQSIGRVTLEMDPIFFRRSAVSADQDFYVRDWTDTPASGDDGSEPSSHAVFYTTSDVWNQRANVAPTFDANNRPVNQSPQNGPGTMGDNFAFARVFRKVAGGVDSVTAHFMYSEFGTGSNYVDAGSPPTVSIPFAAGDISETMTSGNPWHLATTTSTHLCMAVELTGANDPPMPPGLLGHAPGWPTTDLAVINDNNKAQRNMGVYPASEAAPVSYYAIAHNAATFIRNMTIGYTVAREDLPRLANARIEVEGADPIRLGPAGELTLPRMLPGENRWIGLTLGGTPAAQDSRPLQVNFFEIVAGRTVNGFAIVAQPGPLVNLLRDNLDLAVATLGRLAASTCCRAASRLLPAAMKLAGQRVISPQAYVALAADQARSLSLLVGPLLEGTGVDDRFGVSAALKSLSVAVARGGAPAVAAAHAAALHKLDALVTKVQKARGDLADVPQTLRWQNEIFAAVPALDGLSCRREMVERTARFLAGFEARKLGADSYPALLRELRPCFQQAVHAKGLEKLHLGPAVAALDANLGDPAALQGAHRRLLLELAALERAPAR